MATPRKKTPVDPAQEANARILADRAARENQKEAERTLASDLGLDLKQPESKAENPVDFLADEWDRKTFGDPVPTYTKIVYGPDPLLASCPEAKTRIEQYGLEAYANATAEAIMTQGAHAVPDPVMQKGLRGAILKFGAASVAAAFRDRILRIPQRVVEIEADREDSYIYPKPLEEAVMKYGRPGMAQKFLSEAVLKVNGMRGYQIVEDENGDPVKVGTLIMGEIPIHRAEARRRHFAEESEQKVRDAQDSFEDSASRAIHDAGKVGFSVLQRGDTIHSNAAGDLSDPSQTGSYLDRDYAVGFTTERQA